MAAKRERDRHPTPAEVREYRRELLAELDRKVKDYERSIVLSAK
jgi:hypothetical protein